MADVDRFGFRRGSKVSKAASLMARPQGATMAEIVEATGDKGTKHNMLWTLRGKGFIVKSEGGRFSLKDKDGADIPEESPSEPMAAEAKEWPLLPEQKLQQTVRRNLDKLEPGLVAIDGGREEGRRDVTTKDQAGNTVVIELWAGKAGQDKVCQLLVYMGEVKAAQNPSGLRGILVARDFQATAKAAASVVPNIALKRYNFLGQDCLTFETA